MAFFSCCHNIKIRDSFSVPTVRRFRFISLLFSLSSCETQFSLLVIKCFIAYLRFANNHRSSSGFAYIHGSKLDGFGCNHGSSSGNFLQESGNSFEDSSPLQPRATRCRVCRSYCFCNFSWFRYACSCLFYHRCSAGGTPINFYFWSNLALAGPAFGGNIRFVISSCQFQSLV